MVKPKFSIMTMLLATAIVALAILAATLLSHIWAQQRQMTSLRQRIKQLERSASSKKFRLESEFVGAHPNPVILFDPRLAKASPLLLRVGNSKYRGAGHTYQVGTGDRPKRSIKMELRLLRSLGKTDYYRLVHTVDGQAKPDLLFEYTGKPKLLVDNDSTTITIGPDRESCIKKATATYDASESERLSEAWLSGPYKPIVRRAGSRPPELISK